MATNPAVKRFYHSLALKYHPDKAGNTKINNRIMGIISESYAGAQKYSLGLKEFKTSLRNSLSREGLYIPEVSEQRKSKVFGARSSAGASASYWFNQRKTQDTGSKTNAVVPYKEPGPLSNIVQGVGQKTGGDFSDSKPRKKSKSGKYTRCYNCGYKIQKYPCHNCGAEDPGDDSQGGWPYKRPKKKAESAEGAVMLKGNVTCPNCGKGKIEHLEGDLYKCQECNFIGTPREFIKDRL